MQRSSKPQWPTALGPGARIALVSPSGPLRNESDVSAAEAHVRSFGWEPHRGRQLLARRGYLAGTDAERLSDLQWALDDPAIDAVWCVRGGYGLTRILPSLSLDGFLRRPKAVLGFSDVTALHAAIASRSGVVTFHTHSARSALPPMSAASLHAAAAQIGQPCGAWPEAIPIAGGTAVGRLVGGNLALLASLCGTPNAISAAGAVLVLEDVNEAAYRVDRMLRQLEQSGALDGCVGLAVGQFTSVPDDENPDALTTDELIVDLAERLRVPCLGNLPIGHIVDQWTVPLGADALLDVSAKTLRVAMPESPSIVS